MIQLSYLNQKNNHIQQLINVVVAKCDEKGWGLSAMIS